MSVSKRGPESREQGQETTEAVSKRKRESSPSPLQVLEFLKICGKLKKTARTGWVRCGVEKHESVADHSWRMGILPLLLSETEGIDATRCMKIGLVHDLAEALVGDITPHCGISKEKKNRLETEAMAHIRSTLGESAVGEEIALLWAEYEAGETAEAKLMKDLDKFEMIAQAEDYEGEQGVDLSDFFASTDGKIRHPQVAAWDHALRRAREERRSNLNQATTEVNATRASGKESESTEP